MMRVLNLAECAGLQDKNAFDQHAVHTSLLRSAPEVEGCSPSKWFVNASFTSRHRLRYPCYVALMRHAGARKNDTFFAVSHHISYFMPRYGPVSVEPNVIWIVMENTYPHAERQVIAPYYVEKAAVPARVPAWEQRKLVLFAGHIPKEKFSTVRLAASRFLSTRGDATVRVGEKRLSFDKYRRLMFEHKFCIVAPGDTHATAKLAETVTVGAAGGCIPLLLSCVALPYAEILDYRAFAVVSKTLTNSSLDELARYDAARWKFFQSRLQEVEPYFAQPRAARSFLLRACDGTLHFQRGSTIRHPITRLSC